jgi:cation transport regulator ChaC
VFGYGSLVAPASVARTIDRIIDHPDERVVTHLHGYGRRWNYGSQLLSGNWTIDGISVREGVVVSLGLEESAEEWCNGVSILVDDDELAALDARESDYELTDITDRVAIDADRFAGQVVTFVPRPGSVERYRRARDDRRAAVRAEYVEIVHTAFDELGPPHRRLFDRTPPPDVPIADIELIWPAS